MKKQNKTIYNPVWRALSSIRTSIVLLIMIAASSVVGTLVPQGNDASTLVQDLNPVLANTLIKFGLFDIYHSLWFRMLILILALNLTACSVSRFRSTLALFRLRARIDDMPPAGMRIERNLLANVKPEDVSSAIETLLRRKYRNLEKTERESGEILYVEKGRSSLFSVYVVHSSILMVLLGAFIGSISGFEGYMTIPEGETVNAFVLKNSDAEMMLPFSIKLEQFNVSYYDNGSPKEYRSNLTFITEGQTERRMLLVNHPTTYKGITFYQSGYGSAPKGNVRIAIDRAARRKSTVYLEMKEGLDYILPDNDGKIRLVDVQSDFMRIGPAVKLSIMPKDKDEIQIWVFRDQQRIRQMMPGFFEQSPKFNEAAYKPYRFGLENIETVSFTGLQVSKDPGVVFIWIGFSMLIGGLFLTFFFPFKRIWILVNAAPSGNTITIAGKANRNASGLERELESYCTKLEKFTS